MKLAHMTMRRALAATAITATAVLIPAIALAVPGGTSAPASTAANASAARCRAGFLTDWIGLPGDGSAGSTAYMLEISNTSGATCTLYGFPGVSALGPGGTELGSPAQRGYRWTELPLTLQPYDTVHVVLDITDVGNFPPSMCDQTTAYALRVYAPGAYNANIVPFTFQACARRGPIFLHVSTTLAGTGIPGVGD